MKYVLDVHCHSISSGHAYSTITENINYAKDKLELLAITDHAPKMPGSCSKIHFLNFGVLPGKVDNLEIIYGVELNIIGENGELDLPQNIIDRLDIKIASLHPPCFAPVDDREYITNTIINVMKNKDINIIGHLGDPRYPIDIEKLVRVSKDTKTLIEINNASLSSTNTRCGGESIIENILKECKQQNVEVILNSDAHYHTQIGDFSNIFPLLKKTNFPDELIVNTSVEKFKSYL